MRCFTVFSVLLLVSAAQAGETTADITFQRGGKEVRRLTSAQISAEIKSRDVSASDEGGRPKHYRCWPMKDVMRLAYGADWMKSEFTEAVLTASDGYASQAQAVKLSEDGGCLAFADLDVEPGHWEPLGRKRADPGPYYLVWTGAEQTAANAYPWPWQLLSIDLIRFEDRYPEVMPRGAAAGSAERRGFELFKTQCMRCHSINREGGKIGPDLNAPQSITAYRTRDWIKSYVKAPSKYRYTEMPDHGHLSDENLEDLFRYFKLKASQPEKDWK